MDSLKCDFFISRVGRDAQWAEWIAGTLEVAGYSTIIQDWIFNPGEEFVVNMNKAIDNCEYVIAIISKAYSESLNSVKDGLSTLKKKNLILIRIEEIKLHLLAPVTYIDFVGKDAAEVKTVLLSAVATKEKPRICPELTKKEKVQFPGHFPYTKNLNERNPYFTGRENVIAELHKTFNNHLVQVIDGTRGVGKTELAKEYAYRYASLYDLVWWIDAESEVTILSAYKQFALEHNLIDPTNNKPDSILAAIVNWADNNDRWLFIFDNIKDEDLFNKYSPRQSHGLRHTLITSRPIRWSKEVKAITIDMFTPAESAIFLTKYTGREADSSQQQLSKKLSNLPFSLEQAAAYMKVYKISYKEYLVLFTKYKQKVISQYMHEDYIQKSINVLTIWKIVSNHLNNKNAKQLLSLCSFFSENYIDIQWFVDGAEFLPNPLKGEVVNEQKFEKLLTLLADFSLIKRVDGKISIHCLLQEAIKDEVTEIRNRLFRFLNENEQKGTIECCVHMLYKLAHNDVLAAQSSARFNELYPHIVSILEQVSVEEQKEEVAYLEFYLGTGFEQLLNYHQALKWYEKALFIRKKALGREHPDTIAIYNNMAGVYNKQGNHAKALELYEKVLSIRKKFLGENHPDTAATYNSIAALYKKQGDFAKALEFYYKAIEIYEKLPGKENPSTAVTYSSIAGIYDNQGHYANAMEWYASALTIREKMLGYDHPTTATIYNNMALVYAKQRKYQPALEYYLRSYKILLSKTPNHPNTQSVKENMECTYARTYSVTPFNDWLTKKLQN